jgi:hypothetical protein
MNQFPNQTMLTPTTIGNGQITPLSSFSSAVSVDHARTPRRFRKSSISSHKRSEDYSTDEFTDRYFH